MDTAASKSNEEAQIRKLVDEWVNALRTKDVNRMMSNYAPDVLVYGLTPPLQYNGVDEYRQRWEAMFNAVEGPIGYEVRELKITTGDGVAFCHSVNRITAKMKGGKEGDEGTWLRVTVCFKKSNGKWLVTHEHASVPIDVEKGKALLDLKP